MKLITPEPPPKHCVVCKRDIASEQIFMCLKCKYRCEPTYTWLDKTLVDIKSTCCNSDVEIISKITCSEKCHEELVKVFEDEFGKYKKVTDAESGVTYKIPIRDIIEKGIQQENLSKYPVWML